MAILNQGLYPDKPTNYDNPDKNLKVYLKWYHQVEITAKNIGFIVYNHELEIAKKLNSEPLGVNVLDVYPSANLNLIYGEKFFKQISETF